MKPKHYTNEQLVRRMMQYSDFGVLAQVFIVEAIRRYAVECKDMTPEQVADMNRGMISGDAWKGVAADIHRQMSVNYGWKDKE